MISSRIETLIKLNETKSFTKTAEYLCMTQPAVSQHIKMLEDELGVKIFTRSNKGLSLTSEGEIVLKYAKRMIALYENLNLAIEDEKNNLTHLTVGISSTVESSVISKVFAKYCNLKNNINVKIISDSLVNLYKMLTTYEIDMAIFDGKILDKNLNSLLLDTDYFFLVASNDNHLSQKTIVTIEDLKKERLILRLPNSETRTLLETILNNYNISLSEFNVILEIDNVSTIKELIQENLGVSILPKSICQKEILANKFKTIPIENLSMARDINIIYHKDFNHPEVINKIYKIYHSINN